MPETPATLIHLEKIKPINSFYGIKENRGLGQALQKIGITYTSFQEEDAFREAASSLNKKPGCNLALIDIEHSRRELAEQFKLVTDTRDNCRRVLTLIRNGFSHFHDLESAAADAGLRNRRMGLELCRIFNETPPPKVRNQIPPFVLGGMKHWSIENDANYIHIITEFYTQNGRFPTHYGEIANKVIAMKQNRSKHPALRNIENTYGGEVGNFGTTLGDLLKKK